MSSEYVHLLPPRLVRFNARTRLRMGKPKSRVMKADGRPVTASGMRVGLDLHFPSRALTDADGKIVWTELSDPDGRV